MAGSETLKQSKLQRVECAKEGNRPREETAKFGHFSTSIVQHAFLRPLYFSSPNSFEFFRRRDNLDTSIHFSSLFRSLSRQCRSLFLRRKKTVLHASSPTETNCSIISFLPFFHSERNRIDPLAIHLFPWTYGRVSSCHWRRIVLKKKTFPLGNFLGPDGIRNFEKKKREETQLSILPIFFYVSDRRGNENERNFIWNETNLRFSRIIFNFGNSFRDHQAVNFIFAPTRIQFSWFASTGIDLWNFHISPWNTNFFMRKWSTDCQFDAKAAMCYEVSHSIHDQFATM